MVAPCDMQAGYTFIAQTASGEDLPVTVPEGGVRQGQYFFSRSSSPSSIIGSLTNMTEWTPLVQNQPNVPGAWKDNWWDCFTFGVFHVSLWNACLCPQIIAAQIMTRLRLNWLGDPESSSQESALTFYRVLLIVFVYWVISTFTAPSMPVDVIEVDDVTGALVEVEDFHLHRSILKSLIYNVANFAFGLYTLLILTKLRHHIRRLDQIPPAPTCCLRNNVCVSDAFAVEDCCMAFWCGCCSVAQMARQTTDYANDPAACCSTTGLLTRNALSSSSTAQQRGGTFHKHQAAPNIYVV